MASGGTPLVYRGNVASHKEGERKLVEGTAGSVTDSLLDFDDDRILDEGELRSVDRQWYDSEESSYFQHEGKYDEDLNLAEKEEHLKYRQVSNLTTTQIALMTRFCSRDRVSWRLVDIARK